MQNREPEPVVSIVVPVQNGESTIEPLLQSLLKLDYDQEKIEVVVVDGKSTDGTRNIVRKYPFKLVVQEKNGLNVARNTGISNSSGEIIAFTDADCLVPNDWARKIAENFNDPEIGCVAGNVKGSHNNFFSEYADNSVVPVMPSFKTREQSSMLRLFHHPAGCNMAFRRDAVEKTGGFDEDIRYGFDDIELVERICNAGYSMVSDPDVMVQHEHRASLMDLLKQHFRYGKGSGVLLRKRGTRERFSTWAFLNLLGFMAWISLTGLFTFLTLATGWSLFAFALFAVTVLPLLIVMVYYMHKARGTGQYSRALIYPLIDFLRGFAFCAGQICQLFRTNENHREF
jgi:glycosyltransferase involved in cell wall biosynthesis